MKENPFLIRLQGPLTGEPVTLNLNYLVSYSDDPLNEEYIIVRMLDGTAKSVNRKQFESIIAPHVGVRSYKS